MQTGDLSMVGDLTGPVGTINFIIDGGGEVITAGIYGDINLQSPYTITGVSLLADQAGSIVVDIWKDTYANFPPTVADTITASAKPTLSSAIKSTDSTLTGWTTAIATGDILRINVDSATTVTRVTLSLKVKRA
jgi:hypothetical protein